MAFEGWLDRRADAYLPTQTAVDSFMPRRVLGELAGALTVACRSSRPADISRDGRVERSVMLCRADGLPDTARSGESR
jgi:hypothetical protein